MAVLSGQAIQVRVCGALSTGTAKAPPPVGVDVGVDVGVGVGVGVGQPGVAAWATWAGPLFAAQTTPTVVSPAIASRLRRSSFDPSDLPDEIRASSWSFISWPPISECAARCRVLGRYS
jgi:hypothetical protein